MTDQKESQTKILTKKEKGSNRHWKNFVDKDYLGSHNLEKGEEMLLTIAKFEGEELVQKVGGGNNEKVAKQVLYFVEDAPKLILNITNGNTIAALYGTHPDQWIGKQIQVYAASVRAFGKTQDAIRVRDFIPKIQVDISAHTAKLRTAKTLDELKALFTSLPRSAQNNTEIIAVKDEIKFSFSFPNS